MQKISSYLYSNRVILLANLAGFTVEYTNVYQRTIKIYNGSIWYDVAGPKEMLDHQHYAGEGLVRYTVYGGYVDDTNIVFMDGGTASSVFSNEIIDGGAA